MQRCLHEAFKLTMLRLIARSGVLHPGAHFLDDDPVEHNKLQVFS